MIPPVVRNKIWKYNSGYQRIFQDSLSFRTIEALYPENKMDIHDLRNAVGAADGAARVSLYNTLLRLKRRGLVSMQCRRYHLRDLGRWFAIAQQLELSFLELCLLACACCALTRCEDTSVDFFMRFYFERILEEYYSKKTLDNVFSSLNSKGFSSRYLKTFIKIDPKVRKDLMSRYGMYFDKLEDWLYDLKANELDIFEKVLEDFSWDKYAKKPRAAR